MKKLHLHVHWFIAGLLCCLATAYATAPSPVRVPPGKVQVMLIRNCLTSLNHASITGNFTVLRDLGSDKFRQRYKAADLSATFRVLSEQKVDLSPVLVQYPKLTQDPKLSKDGRLQLVGRCETQPVAVIFALAFQYGPAGWAIDDIIVSFDSAADVAPATFQQPAKQ